MKRAWLAGVLLLAGCGAKVIGVGSEAVFVPIGEDANLGGRLLESGSFLPGGTLVRISYDPGPTENRSRIVRVICLDGPNRNETAMLPIDALQPR